eukprot:m.203099 g.203099  ORF g.203099 m.203099 type:complete len:134 (-) comp15756_c0_seq5:3493-3894(-)
MAMRWTVVLLQNAKPTVRATVKRCKRIIQYDKRRGEYIRCGSKFTDETNDPKSCRYHEIGLFEEVGPGVWWNCCKKIDPEEPGCKVGYHCADVDDSEIRGHSEDPKSPEQVKELLMRLSNKQIGDGNGREKID